MLIPRNFRFSPDSDIGAAGDDKTDDTTTDDSQTDDKTDDTTPDTGPDEKSFSQTQVDDIVKKRLDKDRRRRRKASSKSDAPKGGDDAAAILAEIKAERDGMRGDLEEIQWARATSKLELNEKQNNLLFSAWQGSDEDMPAFIQANGGVFGSINPDGDKKDEKKDDAPPNVDLPLGGTRKVDRSTDGGIVNIFEMEVDQLEQLGPHGVREEFEKIVADASRRSGAPPLPQVLRKK